MFLKLIILWKAAASFKPKVLIANCVESDYQMYAFPVRQRGAWHATFKSTEM